MATKSYGTVSPEQQRAMSGLDFVKGLASGVLPLNTFAQTLGYDVVEAESGRIAITITPTGAHLNPWGTVHGGLTATLQDFACPGHHIRYRRDQGRRQSPQLWASCWHGGRPRHGRQRSIARARYDDLSHFSELMRRCIEYFL